MTCKTGHTIYQACQILSYCLLLLVGQGHFLAPLNRMKTNSKLLVIRTRPSRALHSCFDGLAKVGHEVERQRLTDDDHGILHKTSTMINANKVDRQALQKACVLTIQYVEQYGLFFQQLLYIQSAQELKYIILQGMLFPSEQVSSTVHPIAYHCTSVRLVVREVRFHLYFHRPIRLRRCRCQILTAS